MRFCGTGVWDGEFGVAAIIEEGFSLSVLLLDIPAVLFWTNFGNLCAIFSLSRIMRSSLLFNEQVCLGRGVFPSLLPRSL